MKKLFSILIAIFMIVGTLSAMSLMTSASTSEPVKVYISDNGLNTNSGEDPDNPVKDFSKAIQIIKASIGDATAAEIILVGDVKVSSGTLQIPTHKNIALTITSNDKMNARLLLGQHLRLGGETLFTNITILRDTADETKVIYTNGNKLTMGKLGVEDDVISGGTGSNKPISISASNAGGGCKNGVDVTINSGTYYYLNTCAGQFGEKMEGDINFVINNATIKDGYIGLIGGFGPEGGEIMAVNSVLKDGSNINDYNVVINGGTFTNTKIVAGAGRAKDQWCKDVESVINGDTVIDINGGTFTNCEIVMGETINERDNLTASLITYNFLKGVTVDLSDIPNSDKATYKALVNTNDIADTLTPNKFTIKEHDYSNIVNVDEESHRLSCGCGCEGSYLETHNWDEGVITTVPTHSADGEKTYTCNGCKATRTETIPADVNTHYYGAWEKYNETQHKHVCTDESCNHTEYADHNWNEGVITVEPTHTTEGVKMYTCADCGEIKSEAVAKTATHSMGEWEKYDAEQHKRVCACGETKYAAHTWDAGTVTKEATVDEEGIKTFTCADCGETKTEAIAKLALVKESGGCGSTIESGMVFVAGFVTFFSICVVFISRKKKFDNR